MNVSPEIKNICTALEHAPKESAVPVRAENNHIGEAMVIAANTRPKLIGGVLAIYDKNML